MPFRPITAIRSLVTSYVRPCISGVAPKIGFNSTKPVQATPATAPAFSNAQMINAHQRSICSRLFSWGNDKGRTLGERVGEGQNLQRPITARLAERLGSGYSAFQSLRRTGLLSRKDKNGLDDVRLDSGERMKGPQNIALRPAKQSDLESISAMLWQLNDLHVKKEPSVFRAPASKKFAIPFLKKLMAKRSERLMVAESEEGMVGFVHGSIRRMPRLAIFVSGKYLYIENLFVAEGHRKRGVGEALIKAIQRWGRARGAKRTEINVWEMDQAIKLYRKLGFRTVSRKMEVR